jgi:hypothetical protein
VETCQQERKKEKEKEKKNTKIGNKERKRVKE